MTKAADRVLALKLVTDVGDLAKQSKGADKSVTSLEKGIRKLGATSKLAFKGALLGGIDALTVGLLDGVAGFKEAERIGRNVERTWKAMGLSASALGGILDDISGKAVSLGFDDDDSVAAFDAFLTKTHDVTESTELLAAAQDLARKKGIPLAQAQKEIARIYDGSSKALKEYGIKGKEGMDAVRTALRNTKGAAKEFVADNPWAPVEAQIGNFFEDIGGLFAGLPPAVSAGLIQLIPIAVTAGMAFGATWQSFALLGFIGLAAAAVTALTVMAGDGTLYRAGMNTGLVVGDAIADGFGMSRWKQAPLEVKTEFLDVISHYVTSWFSESLVPGFRTGWNMMVNAALAPFQRLQTMVQNLVGSIRDAWNSIDISVPAFDFAWPRQGFEINTPMGNAFVGVDAGSFHFWDANSDLFPDVGTTPHRRDSGRGRGSHEGGLWDVPFDGYPAILHKREMVVPSDFAERYRGSGGMGGNVYITVNASPLSSPSDVGRAVNEALRAFVARGGRLAGT